MTTHQAEKRWVKVAMRVVSLQLHDNARQMLVWRAFGFVAGVG